MKPTSAADSRAILDSNILAYALSDNPRSETARKIVQQHFVISVQSLNEFANVARQNPG